MQVFLKPAILKVHCVGSATNGCLPRETSAFSFEACMPAGLLGLSLKASVSLVETEMPLPPHFRALKVPDNMSGALVSLLLTSSCILFKALLQISVI